MRYSRTITLAALVALASTLCEASETMLRGRYGSRSVEGRKLYETRDELGLLARDGQWLRVKPKSAGGFRPISSRFRSLSAAEMRSQLTSEFGRHYEVTGTGHYLVVHPRGQGSQWANHFEQLYRNFSHYFSVRGLKLRRPEFPLVAVVWANRVEFLKAAAREGSKLPSQSIGYYSQRTNRIMLYDQSAGRAKSGLSSTMPTIIHEATHQTAFNTGIHNRFGQTPRWVVEGLGTMFESRGVWNSHKYPRAQDRIDKARLANFREYLKRRKPQAMADLIASDRSFKQDIAGAYAESWALTLYLVETQPQQYCRYLQKTADRPSFRAYTGAQRLDDFNSVFRKDLKLLEAQYLRYMKRLPGG